MAKHEVKKTRTRSAIAQINLMKITFIIRFVLKSERKLNKRNK